MLALAYIIIAVLAFFTFMYRKKRKKNAIALGVVSVNLSILFGMIAYRNWILRIAIAVSVTCIIEYVLLIFILSVSDLYCGLDEPESNHSRMICAKETYLGSTFLYTLIVICYSLIGWILVTLPFNDQSLIKPCDPVVVDSKEIIQVADNYPYKGSINGGFFLFSGVISGELSVENVYRFYYKDSDGSIKQASVDASSSSIYFIENYEIPHVDTEHTYRMIYCRKPAILDKKDPIIHYNFYIPNNSMLEKYELDLE